VLQHHVKHKSFKMLQLLFPSLMKKLSTPQFLKKFFKNLKKHITLLPYLLPCPAACVPVAYHIYFIDDLLLFPTVKEFSKLVNS